MPVGDKREEGQQQQQHQRRRDATRNEDATTTALEQLHALSTQADTSMQPAAPAPAPAPEAAAETAAPAALPPRSGAAEAQAGSAEIATSAVTAAASAGSVPPSTPAKGAQPVLSQPQRQPHLQPQTRPPPAAAPTAAAPTKTARKAAPPSAQSGNIRSIDRVLFGQYSIKTWYFSPYPLHDLDYSELNPGPSSLTKKTRRSTAKGTAPSQIALTDALYICEGCFFYSKAYNDYWAHKKDCKAKCPPGRKVYQRGAHTIWEVDGAKEFDYCLNLCLFGKLFIDHKTLYFDVDPFFFYIITNGEGATDFDRPYGYFSKEKVSHEDYNLACIVTFPPYQRQGWGAMMIEFSYYLSALSDGNIGTPERPLSDLGLKGFLSYWTSVLLRTLALAFMSSHDTEEPPVLLLATTSLTLEPHEVRLNAAMRIRRLLLGYPAARVNERPRPENLGIFDEHGRPKPRELWTEQEIEAFKKVKRAPVGWAGEVMARKQVKRRKTDTPNSQGHEPNGQSHPQDAHRHPADEHDGHGPAAPAVYEHPFLDPAVRIVSIQTTLERLSIACNLRTEDLSFAMAEIGLLNWRIREEDSEPIVIPIGQGAAEKENTRTGGLAAAAEQSVGNHATATSAGGKASGQDVVVITKEEVWAKIGERKLKKPVLDEAYILY